MTHSPHPDPDGRADLVARLGLPPEATDAEVRAAVAATLGTPRRRGNPLLVLAALALTAAVIVGVYLMGRNPAVPAPEGPTATTRATAALPTIDAAKVTALKARLASNPDDVAALGELGDLYSLAGDAATARGWHEQALRLRPDDTDLLLAHGVDLFNLDDLPGAIAQWTRVTELKPTDAEAWYNIGWAHLQSDPPATDQADAAWEKVVELAPDSDMAKTVRTHLPGDATASATPVR